MKKILLFIIMLLTFCPASQGAPLSSVHPAVTVCDLGDHPDAADYSVNLMNIGRAASDFLVEHLTEISRFDVIDMEPYRKVLEDEGIAAIGLIPPADARRIGELTGASYLIYGNVTDVSVSDTGTDTGTIIGGITVGTTRARIVIRMMDISTGEIVTGAKGEGRSKTSYVKVKPDKDLTVSIGTKKVTQDSVTSAVRKAAADAADLLTARFYGEEEKKK